MQARIIVGILIIVGLVGYLAFVGFEEGRSYYVTCDEVAAAEAEFRDTNLKLAGVVVDGSITRDGDILTFELEYDGATYPVRYIGMDPVPDTFKDGGIKFQQNVNFFGGRIRTIFTNGNTLSGARYFSRPPHKQDRIKYC